MCIAKSIFMGGEVRGILSNEPWHAYSSSNADAPSGTTGRPNSTAEIQSDGYVRPSMDTSNGVIRTQWSSIPWEEVLVDFGFYLNQSNGGIDVTFWSEASQNFKLCHYGDGTFTARINSGVEQIGTGTAIYTTASGNWNILEWHHGSCWFKPHASAGFFHYWYDTLTTGIATWSLTGTNTGSTSEVNNIHLIGLRLGGIDDLLCRPRCIRIRDSGSPTGTPTYGGSLAGTTESATVYAWETNSSDSEGRSGDPNLANNEFRLYLKSVSFDPNETSATGFANGETVSITGVTAGGTLTVYAPHGAYDKGLEPGGMLFGNRFYILSPDISGAGNYNSLGTATLGGGAVDVQDALDTPNDSKYIEHTTNAERLTQTISAIPNQSAIGEVVSVAVSVVGVNDGGQPTGITPTIRDNSTDIDGISQQYILTNRSRYQIFEQTAAGGQFTIGTGAGGVESLEVGYESANV